ALVMLATLPIAFFLVWFRTVKGIPLYAKVQRSVDNMVRVVREDAQGVRVIKALSKNEYENRRYDGANRVLAGDETRVGIIMGSVRPVMSLLMNVGVTVVVALSALRVSNNLSDSETVIAFLQYFTQITMAMLAISRVLLIVTKCIASSARITEVLETERELLTQPCVAPCQRDEKEDFITFKDVSFSYTGRYDHVSNISFSLKKGASLGIIGATGSGKSSLVRLLLRAYDTTEGEVSIAGKNVKCYEKEELAALFGVALQKDFLYADTIEENILFGRSFSHEEVEHAARIACAHDFITSFPEGYGRMLSTGGTNLSGGQRQRVLLARALCGKPEILVLDDASSALDYKTDALFRENLAKEMADVTTITVAQRISSIKHCDLILLLEEGKIIGRGTHEELLRDSAVYREISETQMGGVFVD
ncbi:MAG: ABC transporter ATP-binding protein, partial [Clostridia bacterium]|nr:ABC transporter ATP-binding protein [Clostridia bacterium]